MLKRGSAARRAAIARQHLPIPATFVPRALQAASSWARGAKRFGPHQFETNVVVMHDATPEVVISPQAYLDQYYLAAEAGHGEISWLGTVHRDGHILLIDKIFLFEQEVSTSSTEILPESIAMVAHKLIQEGRMDDVNRIKFWGHLHPGNSTSPSGQDENQMDTFRNGNDWFLRGIFGREGRAEFTFFDYIRGLRYNDIPWSVALAESQERRRELAAEVAEKVREAVQAVHVSYAGGYARHGAEALGLGEEEIEIEDFTPDWGKRA